MSVQGFRYQIFNSKDISPSNEAGYGPYASIDQAITEILQIFRVPAQGESVPERTVTGYVPPLGLHFGVISNGVFTEYEYKSGAFNQANVGIGIVPSGGSQGASITLSDNVPTGVNGDTGNSNVALSTVGAYTLAQRISSASGGSGVTDVKVNGSSVVSNGVANITISGSTDLTPIENRLSRIEAILGDLMGVNANSDATFNVLDSMYTLKFAYQNYQGIDAAPRQVSMTTFGIYDEDDLIITNNKNDLTNVSVVGRVDFVEIARTDSITGTLSIPGNTSNKSRDINITVSGRYNGQYLRANYILPQGADKLTAVTNIQYNGSTTAGTTLDPDDFIATGTFLSNKSPEDVMSQSVSPTTIQAGTNTYTVTFRDGVTGTISITAS